MTVDSKYAPVSFNAHTGTDYIFEIESIGETAIEVYSIDSGGVRTLLTASQYVLVFEEHRDPIYIRGKVILGTPLSAGEQLQIMRKTPISTEFSTTALQPFPSEQFEYTLDQICYIQQEIEGHYCACYDEKEWPPGDEPPITPPGYEPPPLECVPYACDAYYVAMQEARDGVEDGEDFLYWPFNPQFGSWVAGYGGTTDLEEYGGSGTQWRSSSESIYPNGCDQHYYQDPSIGGSGYSQWRLNASEKVVNQHGTFFMAFLFNRRSLPGSYTGTALYQITRWANEAMSELLPPAFTGGLTQSGYMRIQYDFNMYSFWNEFQIRVTGTHAYSPQSTLKVPMPEDTDTHWIMFEVESPVRTSIDLWRDGNGPDAVIPATLRIYVDDPDTPAGELVLDNVISPTVGSDPNWEGSYTLYDNDAYTDGHIPNVTYLLYANEERGISHVSVGTGGIDIETLKQQMAIAHQRNFDDYTPPEYC